MYLIDRDKFFVWVQQYREDICPPTNSAFKAVNDILTMLNDSVVFDPDNLRLKGRWNIVELDKATNRITIECTECGMVEETSLTAYGLNRDFCPSCGADMRGGGEDG